MRTRKGTICFAQYWHWMLTSTELPCGTRMNSCSYALDLLTRSPLHLSKGWASGWSRPSHLLMSWPVKLLHSCPVPLDQEYGGLQGPDIRSYSPRGLWCGRLVLTAHIRQILFFGPGLHPRFPRVLVLVLLVRFTQDRHSSLWWCNTFPVALEFWRNRVPWKGTFSYDCNLGSLKGNERCVPGHISFVPVATCSDF